jgi:molybdopterin-guanine dinucleotide biosynthesis protein A
MGFDKTMLLVEGVPCAQRAGAVMVRVLDPVIEVGPGRSGLPAVLEEAPGGGPLAAVVAGTQALSSAGGRGLPVIVVAGDQPFVSDAALRMLAEWPGDGSVVPVVESRAQPLCARWSSRALAEAEHAAASGERSMRSLVAFDDVELVTEDHWPVGVTPSAFGDIDTPADLVRLGLSK